MHSGVPRKTRSTRRFVRTFFAHRGWLLTLAGIGALFGAGLSLLQETTYRGRLELASAPENAPTRVQLPDNARLWQLVYSPENLGLLVPRSGDEIASIERVSRSVELQAVTSQPTGSSVWGLELDVPAPSPQAAKEMLDRYATRLDADFRERSLLVRRSKGTLPIASNNTRLDQSAAPHAKETPVEATVKKVAFDGSSTTDLPEAGANKPVDAQSLELAKELGVSIDRLPFVVDQFQVSVERKAKDIVEREERLGKLIRSINQIETGGAWSPSADLAEASPEISSLLTRREELKREQSRLASYLRPAHPDYQAVERSIADIDRRLKDAKQSVTHRMQTEIQQMELELKTMRDELAQDRERLQHVTSIMGSPQAWAAAAAPRIPIVAGSGANVPQPLPENLVAAVADKPIGRVVIRSAMVDPDPIRPRTNRNILLGILFGVAVYLVMVFVRASADQRVHGIDDLESLAADLNVFGSIPRLRRAHPVGFSKGRSL